jgi:hypothetical protein
MTSAAAAAAPWVSVCSFLLCLAAFQGECRSPIDGSVFTCALSGSFIFLRLLHACEQQSTHGVPLDSAATVRSLAS